MATPIILTLRVDWSEMDLFGHINNVMYAKYIQSARVNFVEKVGIMKMLEEDKVGFMLASSALEYKRPLYYPDNIRIETTVSFIKTTSFGLQHQIFSGKGELSTIGTDILVMYDFITNQKTPVPEQIKAEITRLEGDN